MHSYSTVINLFQNNKICEDKHFRLHNKVTTTTSRKKDTIIIAYFKVESIVGRLYQWLFLKTEILKNVLNNWKKKKKKEIAWLKIIICHTIKKHLAFILPTLYKTTSQPQDSQDFKIFIKTEYKRKSISSLLGKIRKK